jgi:large conductance mechanosensitive channel
MGRIRELLAHGGIALLAVVFALAAALFGLATALAGEVVSVLQQQTFDEGGGGTLSFSIADTEISYAEVLLYGITAALVALALFAVWTLTRRAELTCPECLSRVPAAASICRYCTSELPPGPADA